MRVLKLCVPLRSSRLIILIIQAKYNSFQLGEQISTAEPAKGRGGWVMALKLCVPLRSPRLIILIIQAKYALRR